jgi:defect in organelle trafficking protein DotD
MDFKHSLAATLLIVLSACSNNNAGLKTSTNIYNHSPSEQLAEAASSISQSMLNIAEIQQATTPPPPNYRPADFSSYGMSNLTSIDWSGPVEPVVKQIADATGYQFKVLGHAPTIPVIVYVASRNQMIGDTLRDIAFQVSRRIHIVVFPATKIIELRYLTSRA